MSSAAKRSSAVGAAADQFDMDQSAEVELQKLQRQFRMMGNEKTAFLEDRVKRSRTQRKLIDMLSREKEQLLQQLSYVHEGPHARRERQQEQKMRRLNEDIETNQKLLDIEKTNLWELEGHIKKLQKEIDRLRLNQVTDSKYKENMTKIQKDVVKLENRLEVANKKAGVVLAENAELRQSIDRMLQERALFNDVWAKMVTQLNQGKLKLMDLIEQSTAAYDQREELCNKLQLLKEKSQSDKTAHVQEMRELQRKLDHDAKLQFFLGVKGQHRVNTELEARENNKRLQQQEEMENQLEEFNIIVEKIKNFSTEENVEKLAGSFKKQEEENFALFNYVNELSHEIETLNETVHQLRENIDEQRALNEVKEKSQMDSIELLEKELNEVTVEADKANAAQLDSEEKLSEMLHGVEKIFRLIRCDDAPVLTMMQKRPCSINNVKMFLGIIQKRTNLLISSINSTEQPCKVLGKKDRVPKFNVRESARQRPST